MSINQLASILENCHSCKIENCQFGKVMKFRQYEGDNEQQIGMTQLVFESLKRHYPDAVGKWYAEESA